jgi:tetratricopeptide (TPR) repeat protein
VIADGKAFVRLAQLRGRIAALARGGRYDVTIDLLGELVRADLALGLPADGLLRARQAAELAEARGESAAGPLVVLAATLLSAEAIEEALDACATAIERATATERPRIEAMARLVGGAAQRRAGRLAEARVLLDAARGAAARLGEAAIAGLALAELGWIDLAEGRPAAAATCFEFAAEFLRRAKHVAAPEADTLAVASWAAAGDVEIATERGPRAADAARAAHRLDLVAFLDGVLADLALRQAPEAAQQACALAAESAQALGASPLARELAAQARLRQVRTTGDAGDRARHLEAGIELALALEGSRAGARLGSFLITLVEDAERGAHAPARTELERLAGAITSLGDTELADMARAVLAELG